MNVIEALMLARKLHFGQVDKIGEAYAWHCVRVMLRLPANASENEKIAALLHDAIEDCGVSGFDLEAYGVPPAAVRLVSSVTREPGQHYDEYIRSIVACGNMSVRIKRADIADNTDPMRLARLDPKDAERLSAKYRKALTILDGAVHDVKAEMTREPK